MGTAEGSPVGPGWGGGGGAPRASTVTLLCPRVFWPGGPREDTRPVTGHWACTAEGGTRTPLPPQPCRCQAGRWAVGRAGPGGRSSGESPESKLQCPKPRSPPAHTHPESTTCCPGSPAIGWSSCPPPWAAGSRQERVPGSGLCHRSAGSASHSPVLARRRLPNACLDRFPGLSTARGRLTTVPVGAAVRPHALARDGSLCY